MDRSEHKGPGALGRIDFGNPSLAPVVRMLAANLRREAAAWNPPPGLRLWRRSLGEADCLVIGPEQETPLPGILYCHGGGFFLPVQCASLRMAAILAKELSARVFLPEYRLLPEHPAPAAFQDCLAAWRAMQGEAGNLGLNGQILLYGESAGGALAAGLALYMRDRGLPPAAGQLLIYPALDDRAQPYPSRAGVEGAAWNPSSNAAMWRDYLRDSPPEACLVPLRARQFSDLPPAYIEPQEFDILRDEAAALARKLEAAGVPVQCSLVRGSCHGFDADTESPFVRGVIARRIAAMKHMLTDTCNKGEQQDDDKTTGE